jgi:hypothetical protein
MARPKRRKVGVGDTIILRNQCIPDHPTLPVTIGGQQTIIPAGLVGQVVEVGWGWRRGWSSSSVMGSSLTAVTGRSGGGSMKPGDLRRFNGNLTIDDELEFSSGDIFMVLDVFHRRSALPAEVTFLVNGKIMTGWGYPWVMNTSEVLSEAG